MERRASQKKVDVAFKAEIYRRISQQFAPSYLLRDFALRRFPDLEGFWLFRKHVAAHLSTHSFTWFGLSLELHGPEDMRFCMDTGELEPFSFDFRCVLCMCACGCVCACFVCWNRAFLSLLTSLDLSLLTSLFDLS